MLLSNLHPYNPGLRQQVRDSQHVSEQDFCICPVNICPRHSQRLSTALLDLVFIVKENQKPCAICSMALGSLFQTVQMFTYFTLEVPAALPPHITTALTPFHFSVLSLHVASWWEIRKDSLESLRAYSSAYHRLACRARQNENCRTHQGLFPFTELHSKEGRAPETPCENNLLLWHFKRPE